LVVLSVTALGTGSLLAPIQLLWINLLSDVLPALGLAFEPPQEDVLSQPPRDAHEPIIRSDALWRLAREGGIIAAGSLGAYAYGILASGSARPAAVHGSGVARFPRSVCLRCRRNPALHRQRGGQAARRRPKVR